MKKRQTCKLCKARRYQSEMTEIYKDVHLCSHKYWRNGRYKGGCAANKSIITKLIKIYSIADNIEGYNVQVNLTKK